MKLDAKLGKRQMEVAEFIGFGYSIKETADHLNMSVETVKSTLKAVYAKIGIQKATELSKFVFSYALTSHCLYVSRCAKSLHPFS